MISLTRWPSIGISNHRTYQSLTLPLVWLRQFRQDLHDIKLYGNIAENDSHAVVLAVHEMAERLRQEQGENTQ